MSCTSPIYGLDLGVKENGKRNIKLLPKRFDMYSLAQLEARYGKGSIIPLPCGKCLACRKSKAREWAVRSVLEASQYDDNCFITLTYDEVFYRPSKKGLRQDITNFFKRLRKDYSFRYFACCERGTEKGRYHFHALLFGVDLDKKTLMKYWSFGFVDVGSLTAGSCFYVAQYAEKKIFKDDPWSFITMSTHPGLGYEYLQKHLSIVENGSVHGEFGSSKVPRYFEKVYLDIFNGDLSQIKKDRLEDAELRRLHEMFIHGLDSAEKLYKYQADIDLHNFENKAKRKDL